MSKRRPSEGVGSKVPRVCEKCWSVQVVYIGNHREHCRMCGNEQDAPKSLYEEDEGA